MPYAIYLIKYASIVWNRGLNSMGKLHIKQFLKCDMHSYQFLLVFALIIFLNFQRKAIL